MLLKVFNLVYIITRAEERPEEPRAINLLGWTFTAARNIGFLSLFCTQTHRRAHPHALSAGHDGCPFFPLLSHHHTQCVQQRGEWSKHYLLITFSPTTFPTFILALSSLLQLFSTFHTIIYAWWALTYRFTPTSINTPKLVLLIDALYCDSTLVSKQTTIPSLDLSCFYTSITSPFLFSQSAMSLHWLISPPLVLARLLPLVHFENVCQSSIYDDEQA